MKRRFWGSIAGAGVALVCLLTACSGGITTSEPIDMNRDGTAPTTAATGTTGNTKDTTGTTGSTATRTTVPVIKPWSMYDPDPVMSFEEYMSEMRLPTEERGKYTKIPVEGQVFVYISGMMMGAIEYAPDSLHEGSIYWWNEKGWYGEGAQEENYRLLRDCRATTFIWDSFMGYTYVAVDGTIYRYKYDGTDETLIFEGERPIETLTGDSYALFFTTDEGLYRLFRPTGQLDRLCDNMSPSINYISLMSNDILRVVQERSRGPESVYVVSLNRQVSADELFAASSFRTIEFSREFCEFVYTYCEEHPE